MPTIRKVLDLSTQYLPPRFFSDTGLEREDLMGAYDMETGMLLWVPADVDEQARESSLDGDRAQPVKLVRHYARNLGCDYILFDSEGELVPLGDLPTYLDQWE